MILRNDMLGDNKPENRNLSVYDTAIALAKLLGEYRGGDVLVMDLRELNGWTDFFVIATVTSNTHLQGLDRHIKEFSQEQGIDILRLSPRPKGWKATADDEWRLIDLGPIVIHLMTAQARAFYELERLWSAGAIVFQENIGSPVPTPKGGA
jgi:ribosome-associated protein